MKLSKLVFLLVVALAAVSVTQCQDTAVEDETAESATATQAAGLEAEEGGTEDLDAGGAADDAAEKEHPVQSGPFIDLLGPALYSLEMVDENRAQIQPHYTNEALAGKNVVGLYFSADWCGPCRQFTPELVQFYNKMNSRRGKEGKFEIVWVSRCRDMDSYGQYFTHMNWLAMPPEEAMGERGQMLSQKYKVQGIPSLVLLDEVGNVITTDGRNKIPQDKAGIGFPWRNPLATLVTTLFPKSLRLMVKSQVGGLKDKVIAKIKSVVPMKS